MKKILAILFVLVFGLAGVAYSSNQAEQIVNFSIQAVGAISVSGDPGTLILDTLDPDYPYSDFDLVEAVDDSTTYSLTVNYDFKVTAELSQDMAYGTWLFMQLEEFPEGYSMGYVVLNDNSGGKLPPQTLLVGEPCKVSGKKVYYKLGADLVAGTIDSGSNVVTLTIVELT